MSSVNTSMRLAPTSGLVTRKNSYKGSDGIDRYIVEVAVVGATVPVFYAEARAWQLAPGDGEEVVISGKLSPGQNGQFRVVDAEIVPAIKASSAGERKTA